MRNVLVGVIFGLLSVVQATPVKTVTQTPVKAEDEVLREAVTDGFLVDRFFAPEPSKESHKSSTTTPRSQQRTVLIEHGGDRSTTPDWSVPRSNTSSTVSTKKSDLLDILNSDFGSGDEDAAYGSGVIATSNTKMRMAPTNSKATVHPQLFGESEGSGSGMLTETTTESTTFKTTTRHPPLFAEIEEPGSGMTTEISTTSSTSTPAPIHLQRINFERSEMPDPFSENATTTTIKPVTETEVSTEGLPKETATVKEEKQTQEVGKVFLVHDNTETSAQNDGRTPGWIIILGFVVGVAALVMLCVAIATRDKWNGPNQITLSENKGDLTDQQGELEMETFLPREEPRENGKSAEYSVIPLEDLPEDSMSH